MKNRSITAHAHNSLAGHLPREMLYKKSHFLILASIISALLILGGYFYYSHSSGQLIAEKGDDLKAIAGLKIDQLVQWHKERTADAKVISLSPLFSNGVEKWLQDKSNKKNEQNIKERLSIAQKEYGYESIILSSVRGDLLLSVGSELERIDDTTSVKIIESAKKDKITFTDFYYCNTHNKIHYDIIAPIADNLNETIAVLIFRVDPTKYIYPLIQTWPTPSKTAETLLLKKDGDSVIYLNELRHQKNTALQLRFPLTRKDIPAVQAASGFTGISEGKDYRGIDVLFYSSSVPGTDWFMVSKVDTDEIFDEIYYRGIIVSIVIVLLILSLTIGLLWIYHKRQSNIYRNLWQVQEEFRTTLYSIGDAVITTDKKGKVKFLNPVAEQLTGWSVAHGIGEKLEKVFKIINEETRNIVENPVERVLREGVVVGLANHTLLISKDGREIPITDCGAPIKDEEGKIVGVVLVFRDQTEERLQHNLLKARLTLFEFAASHTLNEILTKTLDEVEVLTNSKIGFYHFLLPDQETINLQAWSTRTEKMLCKADGKGLHYKLSEAGVWSDCVHQKKPVIHNDYASLPDKKGMPDGHAQVIRELVVPILRNDKIVAVLGVGNKPGDYTDKDVEIVTFIADVAWVIAEQKKAEEELRGKEQKLRNIFEHTTNLFYCHDTNHVLNYLSPQIKDLLGYEVEEALIKWIEFASDNSINEIGFQKTVKAIETGEAQEPYELELVHKDGRKVLVEGREAPVVENGKTTAIVGSLNDITERKRAENELRKLSRAVEQSPASVVITNPAGDIQYVNIKFSLLTGYSKEEAIGKNPRFLQSGHQDKIVYEAMWDTILSGKEWAGELLNKKKNGELYWESALISPLVNEGGDITHFLAIKEDITERKKMLSELITAKEQAQESDRLKSAFLTNMSHEIRTPMNGILGFAKLLEEPNLTSEEQKDFIQTIQKCGDRMLNTINNIIDISKIESGLMKVDNKESNINEQIEFLYKFFKPEAEQKELQFSFIKSLPSEEAVINTDIEKVYGILTNLIKNAIKFTNEGSIEFGYEKKGEYLEFFVKDTGTGISSAQKEIIFERFRQGDESFTRNYEGAGLGLSISKAYAEMLDGKLWVESETGEGSIFYFTIPYNAVSEEKNAIEIAISGKDKAVQIRNLKILVAEDDKISDLLLTKLLQNISSEILHVKTGVEVIESCLKNPDLDLVLMDIKMPDMDGYEATRQIRQFNKDVTILAQTAYGLSDDRDRAIEAGCNDYIAKPIKKTELLALIQKYFNKYL